MPRTGTRTPPPPLTPEEIEQLHLFLMNGEGDLNNFDMLDGFITAVALVPEPLLPAVWYSNIFGGADDEETDRRVVAAEAEGSLSLIIRHWGSVVHRLARGGPWTMPVSDDVFMNHEWWWAMGFSEGMDRSEEFWEDLTTRERYLEVTAAVQLCVDQSEALEPGQPDLDLSSMLPREPNTALIAELVTAVNRMYREFRRGVRS
jgi:yecA family protein